jgi:hypothetical protein
VSIILWPGLRFTLDVDSFPGSYCYFGTLNTCLMVTCVQLRIASSVKMFRGAWACLLAFVLAVREGAGIF